jgi:hypothetical protein
MKIIHILRKPPSEGTVAANTLKHGTGGLNIAASRVGTNKRVPKGLSRAASGFSVRGFSDGGLRNETGDEDGHNPNIGRFPANVILQHLDGCRCDGVKKANWICEPGCPVARLDEQSGVAKSAGGRTGNKDGGGIYGGGKGLAGAYSSDDPGFGDTGGASRYFKQVGGKRVE